MADEMKLEDGARVAVVGGGPAGSFFTIFFLKLAAQQNLRVSVAVYEPRDFGAPGPPGCNMCGGIISEDLVRAMAGEGIKLPPEVIRRTIDAYVMHSDAGTSRIEAYRAERRIVAVYRGAGPRNSQSGRWKGFDRFLQEEAVRAGGTVIRERVQTIERDDGRPVVVTATGKTTYDLVVDASGINSQFSRCLKELIPDYEPPGAARSYVCELPLSEAEVNHRFGNAMHVFLLDIPKIRFAAIIPKAENVTVCMIGDDIGRETVREFFAHPLVSSCFPPHYEPPEQHCRCSPSLNARGARLFWGDRIVSIGDSGITRLNKDGINGAFMTARAAARVALLHGVSGGDFSRYYAPFCRRLERDNSIGRIIFSALPVARSVPGMLGLLRQQVCREQMSPLLPPRLSSIFWDMFTGSAKYSSIMSRLLDLRLGFSLLKTAGQLGRSRQGFNVSSLRKETRRSDVGGIYQPGEVIFRTGDYGDCMYIITSGVVEIMVENQDVSVTVVEVGVGDSFGETALFNEPNRAFTARAKEESTLLTIDRDYFLKRIQEDPSFALTLLQKLCDRLVYMREVIAHTDPAFNRDLIASMKMKRSFDGQKDDGDGQRP